MKECSSASSCLTAREITMRSSHHSQEGDRPIASRNELLADSCGEEEIGICLSVGMTGVPSKRATVKPTNKKDARILPGTKGRRCSSMIGSRTSFATVGEISKREHSSDTHNFLVPYPEWL